MPKNSRKITEPLFETTERTIAKREYSFIPSEIYHSKKDEPLREIIKRTIPKWKLSFISSELYHSKENEPLREIIETGLRGIKLHPLTKVDLSTFEPKVWILLAVIWREMLLGELDRKEIRKYLEAEKQQRRKMLVEKKRLIKKIKNKKKHG